MNYKEAKEYIKINDGTFVRMKAVIGNLINNKNLAFKSSKVEEMNLGDSFFRLFDPYYDNSSFILKRKERLVGTILLSLLEDSIGQEISNDLAIAFNEIDEYLLFIKQPNPRNTWYLHLDTELIEYVLLKFYHDHKLNLVDTLIYLENVEEKEIYRRPENHFFNFVKYFFEIINEISLTTEP